MYPGGGVYPGITYCGGLLSAAGGGAADVLEEKRSSSSSNNPSDFTWVFAGSGRFSCGLRIQQWDITDMKYTIATH